MNSDHSDDESQNLNLTHQEDPLPDLANGNPQAGEQNDVDLAITSQVINIPIVNRDAPASDSENDPQSRNTPMLRSSVGISQNMNSPDPNPDRPNDFPMIRSNLDFLDNSPVPGPEPENDSPVMLMNDFSGNSQMINLTGNNRRRQINLTDNEPPSPTPAPRPINSARTSNVVKTKDPSRKKKIILIGGVVAIIVIISVVLAVLLTRGKEEATGYGSSDMILVRNWRQGAQEVYKVNYSSEMVMGTETSTPSTSSKEYTVTSTTQEVNGDNVVLNFLLLPGDATLFGESGARFLAQTQTPEQLAASAAEAKLMVTTCQLLKTGKISSCSKPTYLTWSEFEFLLNIVDQLSPILEKKYFDGTRLLQEGSTESYVEGRKFTFADNGGQVSVKNTFDNKIGNAGDDSKFSMGINTALDAKTGQILNSKQSNQLNMNSAANNDAEIIKVAKVSYQTELNLKSSTDASPEYLDFVATLTSITTMYETITDPLVNKADSEKDNTVSSTSEDIQEDVAGNGRLLAATSGDATEDTLIMTARHNLFTRTIFGSELNGVVNLECFEKDTCTFKTILNTFGKDFNVYKKDFDFKISSITKAYKWVRVNVLKHVRHIGNIVRDHHDTILALTKALQTEFDNMVPSLTLPLEEATTQLTAGAVSLANEISTISTAFSPLDQALTGLLRSSLYQLETLYTKASNDMFYFTYSFDAKLQSLKTDLETKYVDEATETLINKFATDFETEFKAYYTSRKTELEKSATVLSTGLTTIAQKIDATWLNIPANEDAALIAKVPVSIKNNFNAKKGDVSTNFLDYHEDALLQLYMDYVSFLESFTADKNELKTLLASRKTATAGQLDQTFLTDLQSKYSSDEMYEIFISSKLTFEVSQEFIDGVQTSLQTVSQNFITSLKKFMVYSSNSFFINAFQTIQTNVATLDNKFGGTTSTFVTKVTNAFVSMYTAFNDIYTQAEGIVKNEFQPSSTNVAELEVVDLFEAADDAMKTFDDVQVVYNILMELYNIVHPVQTMADTKTHLDNLATTIQKNVADLTKAFTDLQTNFDINLDIPVFDIPQSKSEISTEIDTLFTKLSTVVKAQVKDASLSFADNSIKGSTGGLKDKLLTKLDSMLPSSAAISKSVFDISKNYTYCYPGPPMLCAAGTLQFAIDVGFEFGAGDGKLKFTIVPSGSVKALVKGYVSIVVAEAGASVDGLLFKGGLPLGMGIDYRNSGNLTLSVGLRLEALSFTARLYVDYYEVSVQTCQVYGYSIPCGGSVTKRTVDLWNYQYDGLKTELELASKTFTIKALQSSQGRLI